MIRKYYNEWPNQIRKIWYHDDNDELDFMMANNLTISKQQEMPGYRRAGVDFDDNLQPILKWEKI